MIIKNITINSFGKLHNYVLDLSNGMNVVYGANEYGKSTIMTFIKLVFYGQFKSGGISSKDLREKYKPWDGSNMSGSITIEHGGQIYKIQKEISEKKASSDKTLIYNLSRGEEVKIGKNEEVGEYFLGIDAMGFERSSYIKNIGGVDFVKSSGTKKISKDTVFDKILSNLADGGEEEFSQSEVVSRIDKAMLGLKTSTGRGGAIYNLEKEIENLKLKINKVREFEKLQEEEKGRRNELETLIGERERLGAFVDKLDSYKRRKEIEGLREIVEEREALRNEAAKYGIDFDSYKEMSEILEEYNNRLHDIDISINQCREMQENRRGSFVRITQKEEEFFKAQVKIRNDIMNRPINTDETQSEISELRCRKGRKSEEIAEIKSKLKGKRRNSVILGSIFLMLLVLFVVYSLFVPAVILGVLVLGIGLTYLYSENQSNKSQEFLSKEIDDISKKIEELNSKIVCEAVKISGSYGEEYEKVNERIQKLLSEKQCRDDNEFYENRALSKEQEKYEIKLNEYENKRLEILDDIGRCLSVRGVEIDLKKFGEYMSLLHSYGEKYNDLEKQIRYKSRILGIEQTDIESIDNLLSTLSPEDNVDIDEEHADSLRNRLKELDAMNLYDKYKESSEKISNNGEDLSLLERKLEDMMSKERKMTHYYNCLSVAKEGFEEAVAEMRNNFSPKLNARASEIFKVLTSGKYDYMRVNKDYEFVVGDNNLDRSAEYLSSGTRDQAYLALRIAISELISSERVPLLFDDTLMQYDDKRLDDAINFLREYADKSGVQSIIFTCHQSMAARATL